MEGSTGNSKIIQKRVPVWAEYWAFGSTQCANGANLDPCSLMQILDKSIVTTPTFIISDSSLVLFQIKCSIKH